MNFIRFSILVVLIIGSTACQKQASNSPVHSGQAFSIEQSVITRGKDLKINLPEKTPANLAVISPDGEFFILQSQDDNISLLPTQKLSGVNNITLDTETQQGALWVNGEKTIVPIFTKPGIYELYLADNLETEPENTFSLSQKFTVR